ncbi:MAG: BON domain-containing protein, partial [bacterium]|nr:BON domain-containing protein [bacterium]
MTREAVAIAHDDISDMGLRKSILEMLELEGYDISHIRIDVEDGVVYLSGEVKSDEAKEEVDVLINEVIGVEEVSNELTTGLDTNDEIDLESDDRNT